MGISAIDGGLRVQRRVTVKGVMQEKTKVFSTKIKVKGREERLANATEMKSIRAAAESYDNELADWQTQLKGAFDPFTPTAKNNTGVRGITRRKHNSHGYEITAYFVCVADDNKKVYSRYHNIGTLGNKKAWTAAVKDLVAVKKLSAKQCKQLLAMCPAETTE